MVNVTKTTSQFADSSDNPLIGDRQSNVADPASTLTATLTAAAAATLSASKLTALVMTYGTDDPSPSLDGTLLIADGDLDTFAMTDLVNCVEELLLGINTLVTLTDELHDDAATTRTLLLELIADHATFITDITDNRTAINSALDVLEAHGFMTAT